MIIDRPDVFEVKVSFQPGTEKPARIFRAMSEMIDSFQALDKVLVKSFVVKIEPTFVLDDIEVGSIKARIRTILEAIDDDALKELDWKKAVGSFLVKAKYRILKHLEDKEEFRDIKHVHEVEEEIAKLAAETEIQKYPLYFPVPTKNLLENIAKIYDATKHLSNNDVATYITYSGEVEIRKEFAITQETIDDILTRETLTSKGEMILLVKKPDYLRNSMWDVQHNGKTIQVKITDFHWLFRFQSRVVDLRPGDSIKAIVRTDVRYGFDNSVVAEHHTVLEVLEVIPMNPWSQGSFDSWQ